jgi:hypothetical protein
LDEYIRALMEEPVKLDLDRPRSAPELIGATFALYRRYSWLFLILAGVVVVPYGLISLVAYPGGPLHGVDRVLVNVALNVGDYALVIPLVSAFHLYAVVDAREGREPELRSVFRRGFGRLRILSPAVGLTWIAISLGFLALIVPGVLLAIRWAVVAQTAALEATSWRDALDRSARLSGRDESHVFWLLFLLFAITTIPFVIHLVAFGATVTVGSVAVSIAFEVLTTSFTALATAFLYYDLKVRSATARPLAPHMLESRSARRRSVPPAGHPLDPASWSDDDRPAGWYVDPEAPWNMRFWAGDDANIWSTRTAKTPKATREEWEDLRRAGEQEEDSG